MNEQSGALSEGATEPSTSIAESHTKGPLKASFGEVAEVRASDGSRVAIVTNLCLRSRRDANEVEANTHRIVTCWNAMEGLSNEQVTSLRAVNAEREAENAKLRAALVGALQLLEEPRVSELARQVAVHYGRSALATTGSAAA